MIDIYYEICTFIIANQTISNFVVRSAHVLKNKWFRKFCIYENIWNQFLWVKFWDCNFRLWNDFENYWVEKTWNDKKKFKNFFDFHNEMKNSRKFVNEVSKYWIHWLIKNLTLSLNDLNEQVVNLISCLNTWTTSSFLF